MPADLHTDPAIQYAALALLLLLPLLFGAYRYWQILSKGEGLAFRGLLLQWSGQLNWQQSHRLIFLGLLRRLEQITESGPRKRHIPAFSAATFNTSLLVAFALPGLLVSLAWAGWGEGGVLATAIGFVPNTDLQYRGFVFGWLAVQILLGCLAMISVGWKRWFWAISVFAVIYYGEQAALAWFSDHQPKIILSLIGAIFLSVVIVGLLGEAFAFSGAFVLMFAAGYAQEYGAMSMFMVIYVAAFALAILISGYLENVNRHFVTLVLALLVLPYFLTPFYVTANPPDGMDARTSAGANALLLAAPMILAPFYFSVIGLSRVIIRLSLNFRQLFWPFFLAIFHVALDFVISIAALATLLVGFAVLNLAAGGGWLVLDEVIAEMFQFPLDTHVFWIGGVVVSLWLPSSVHVSVFIKSVSIPFRPFWFLDLTVKRLRKSGRSNGGILPMVMAFSDLVLVCGVLVCQIAFVLVVERNWHVGHQSILWAVSLVNG